MARVRVEQGELDGLEVDGLHFFRNIPFAAAPFGENRFLAPRPPASWDGVRDATKPGPAAPQPFGDEAIKDLYVPTQIGEDCLTLEVWTPDPGAKGLPVMVHIHGGGYTFGAGSLPGYSGKNFARDGVVHVGINYRLGLDGFLLLEDSLDEDADNRGLRDQVAALQWVQRNIAAFGGDPANVTIFGQSGGAVSVMFQLAIPSASGLFARAISQSGCSMASVDADEALRITRQVAKRLGVAPTRAGMSGISLEKTNAASMQALVRYAVPMAWGNKQALLLSPFRGVHGTAFLPKGPADSAGSFPNVPLLAGTTLNEAESLLSGIVAAAGPIGPLIRVGLRRGLDMKGAIEDAYRSGPRQLRGTNALAEAGWTDWGFRMPTIRLVERRPETSWLYQFEWQREGIPAHTGSVHAIDLPFVRDDLEAVMAYPTEAAPVFGAHPPKELAQRMHADFVRFATTGDPGWPPYDETTRTTMLYDTTSGPMSDAAGVEREAWSGRR